MAAFQQYPALLLVDSAFSPAIKAPGVFDEFIPYLKQFYSSFEKSNETLIVHNQKGSSIDLSAHESSCLEQLSTNEPSSVNGKQRTENLPMAEQADSGEQLTQRSFPVDKKRKTRKGSSPNSANIKEAKKGRCKKQKEGKAAMKEEKNNGDKTTEEPPKGYIHVRARRGQATDSHSLAERLRREKISERMKMLQALVPGCDKVTGKALMLDEIINYVQSLQNQVEFLSMKLASVDPMVYNIGLMDQDPMIFGAQVVNNGMALPMPIMQTIVDGGSSNIDPPQAITNTNALSCTTTSSATTPTFPANSIVDNSAPLFQQEEKPTLLPSQDAGNLCWGVNEQQRQNTITHFGFNGANLYSFE